MDSVVWSPLVPADGTATELGTAVAVGAGVAVGTGVDVGAGVAVGKGVAVGSGVGLGSGVAVGIGVFVAGTDTAVGTISTVLESSPQATATTISVRNRPLRASARDPQYLNLSINLYLHKATARQYEVNPAS
jgi:hypothetical protein